VLRSWPEQANDDPSEVKRLRQSLSQAEQEVGLLKERLFDAKSAQARANHGLQDKDTRLAMLSKQFESSSSTQAHHAEVVETLQNELQRARQQVEALSQQALQMQGKLREIEDWRAQAESRWAQERLKAKQLNDHIRSEADANHIIDLLSAKEAQQLAVTERQREEAARMKAEEQLSLERAEVCTLRAQVKMLTETAPERHDLQAHIDELQHHRTKLGQQLHAQEFQMSQLQYLQTQVLLDLNAPQRQEQARENPPQTSGHHPVPCEKDEAQQQQQDTEEVEQQLHHHQDMPCEPPALLEEVTGSKEEQEECLLDALPPSERAAALELRQQVMALRQQLAALSSVGSIDYSIPDWQEQTHAQDGQEQMMHHPPHQEQSSLSFAGARERPQESAGMLGDVTRLLSYFCTTQPPPPYTPASHAYSVDCEERLHGMSSMGAAGAPVNCAEATHKRHFPEDKATGGREQARHDREGFLQLHPAQVLVSLAGGGGGQFDRGGGGTEEGHGQQRVSATHAYAALDCISRVGQHTSDAHVSDARDAVRDEGAMGDEGMAYLDPNCPHWWSTWLACWGT